MATCYPPIHHHSTTNISSSEALSFLSAYLEATLTDPALHPNALLTDSGPITPSSSANLGLILHNLKRVEAGLKGEHLGADLISEQFDGAGLPDPVGEDAVTGGTEIPVGGVESLEHELEGEWQDKEEYERQQDVVQGELGKRDNAQGGGSKEQNSQIPRVTPTKSIGEIDARKKAKKERKKKERKVREETKKGMKDSES